MPKRCSREELEKADAKIGASTVLQVGVYQMRLYGQDDVNTVEPTVGNDLRKWC